MSEIWSNSETRNFNSAFLLFSWKKSNKNSRLYNNAGSSKPEVSARNTRHERILQIQTLYLAVYSCPLQAGLHTCPSHIPPSKNCWRIFIMPVPSKKYFSYDNILEHGFGLTAGFTGCRDRHYKISVVVQGGFCVRGAFQAMQKWAMRILLFSRNHLYGERLALRSKNLT